MTEYLSPSEVRHAAAERLCECGTPDPTYDGHSESCRCLPILEVDPFHLQEARDKFWTTAEGAVELGRGRAASFWLNMYLRADAEFDTLGLKCEGCGTNQATTASVRVLYWNNTSWIGRLCDACCDTNYAAVKEIIQRVD